MTRPPDPAVAAAVTGEGVAVHVRPAGVASRGLAFIVDMLVQGAALIGLGFLAAAVTLRLESAAAQALVLTLGVLLVLGYPVLFETLMAGRTPGKMALGLRVVRDDGGPIRFRHALVRGLVGVVLDRPGASFALLAVIPMLLGARHKRLGDLAAGTIVVQERVPAATPPPPAMPAGLETWAASLDLSAVDDELALRVRAFLGRAGQLTPAVREDLGSRLLAEVAARVATSPPPGMPGWAYLTAVLAERRRRDAGRSPRIQ